MASLNNSSRRSLPMSTTENPQNLAHNSAIVLTGPTRGLGPATAVHLARHPSVPTLLLLGRPGPALDKAVDQVRSAGGSPVVPIYLEQSDLASIRQAGEDVVRTLRQESVPLRATVANAGIQTTDLNHVTQDGFELTFGVNVLGTYLLLLELGPHLAAGVRVVLVGSGTADDRRKDGLVPVPRWQDPEVLARPSHSQDADTLAAGRRAYSTSKLGTLYLAHGLARRAAGSYTVDVFDPGMMPGTGLARDASLPQRIGWNLMSPMARGVSGMSTPQCSGLTRSEERRVGK